MAPEAIKNIDVILWSDSFHPLDATRDKPIGTVVKTAEYMRAFDLLFKSAVSDWPGASIIRTGVA